MMHFHLILPAFNKISIKIVPLKFKVKGHCIGITMTILYQKRTNTNKYGLKCFYLMFYLKIQKRKGRILTKRIGQCMKLNDQSCKRFPASAEV